MPIEARWLSAVDDRTTCTGAAHVLVCMRTLLAVTLAWLVVLPPAASAREARARGPWLLVALSSLGTVTWRCDATAHPRLAPELPALALGFKAFAAGQSGSVRLVVGSRTIVSRTIQPGQSIRFPYLGERVQRLDVQEGGEDGTLRAAVTVDFAPHATSDYCWPYMPPGVVVRLLPRR
jgi:hypothetical protein